MKLRLVFCLTMLAVAIASVTSCSSEKPVAARSQLEPGKESSSGNSDARKRMATEKFIEAEKMNILGDHQQALNTFKEVLKIDPTVAAAYYNIAKILFDNKQYNEAAGFASQAVKLESDNPWYLDLYGTLLGGIGNYKEAEKTYAQMVRVDDDNPDAWFNWAFFTEQNKQYADALNIFSKIETQFGSSDDVTNEKVKLWLVLGKKDKAAAELQHRIDVDPSNPQYYSKLVDFYMTNGMEDEAYKTLQQLVALNPNDPRANLVLAGYYRHKGEDAKAADSYMKAFGNPGLDINMGIGVLVGYLQFFQPGKEDAQKKQEALMLAKTLAQSHPREAKAQAMYGDLLYQNNDDSEALASYKRAIQLDSSKFMVWQQLFFIYDTRRNYDSLLLAANTAVSLFPDQALAYYFSGYASMQLKRYDDAVKSLGKAVAIGAGDSKLLSQIYAQMGDAWYELRNNHASDSCYELALVFDPSNVYVLNNYSYYLSLRNEKLDEARHMSEQANILEPNTAAYEDTYAWVLFKSAKYNDAREWAEKALKHGGDQDGTVLEHYGDILFKLGDVDGAVANWIKAKSKNVDSLTIDKKISERKLFE